MDQFGFALHGNGSLPGPHQIANYFARLRPGLTYRDVPFDENGVPQLPHGFLVCEDFGTRGLGGDPYRATDPPDGTKGEDFFWFWRNIGHSGKTGDDLGRWGLGKTVYRAASRVGCMLGLTVRHSDGKKLLMGQAVLRIHKHDETEYAPEGFWCCGCNDADTPLFARDWLLTKGVSSAAVFSGEGSDSYGESIERLRSGELQALCVVDMFNEGLDIPAVDRVVMLRPTESKITFLQ